MEKYDYVVYEMLPNGYCDFLHSFETEENAKNYVKHKKLRNSEHEYKIVPRRID